MKFLETFGFCKRCLESWYLWLGTKILIFLFFMCLAISLFSWKIYSTQLTLWCFKLILQMNEHIHEAITVRCREESARWNGRWKRHILLNSKLSKNAFAFSYCITKFIAPNNLEVDSPLTCFQGGFTNSYNHKWLSFIWIYLYFPFVSMINKLRKIKLFNEKDKKRKTFLTTFFLPGKIYHILFA